MKIKILALDQALIKSGYAIIEPETGSIEFGEIRAPKRVGKVEYDLWSRIQFIRDRVLELAVGQKCTHIVLERSYISQTKIMSSALSLHSVYGALQLVALDLKIPIGELTPAAWPKVLGLSSTKGVLFEELKQYGIKSDHESDAIGVGLAYLVTNKLVRVNIDRNKFKYQSGILYQLGKCVSTSEVPSLPTTVLSKVCRKGK